jgi:septum formation protein
VVVVSTVDEEAHVAAMSEGTTPAQIAEHLATAKAREVGARFQGADASAFLVLGCDSVFDFDGVAFGKPRDSDEAVDRWRSMRGRDGVLITGHCLIDSATGDARIASAHTTVRFGEPDDVEIAAYVATGEPLAVAGACTLDGISAPFITGIDGDPSNVIGLSLPLLRDLVRSLGHSWPSLWDPALTSG